MDFVRAELIVGNQVSIMLGTNWTQTRDIGNIAFLSFFLQTSLRLVRTNIPQYGSRAPLLIGSGLNVPL